ncbi:MAG: SUMF1/EgtB/PvdO family nonheme iron enzyme [Pseudomonadota bacterium]
MSDKPHDIFISYAREDDGIADKLHKALKALGWSVFRDVTMLAGQRVDKVIDKELDSATCVVVLWSDAALQSDWVPAEASRALRAKKLVPVKLQDVTTPVQHDLLNYTDLFGWTPTKQHDGYDVLVASVRALAGDPTPAAPEVPPEYVKWVKDKYTNVDLLGQQAEKSHAFQLDNVYVPALTAARQDEMALARGREDKQEGPRFEPLLNRLGESSCYILAQAGTGKSTFCRWVMLQCLGDEALDHPVPTPDECRESIPESLAGHLPVLVPLREFGPRTHFPPGAREWCMEELEAALAAYVDEAISSLGGDQLRQHLGAGTAILLIDGLDELPESAQGKGSTAYPRELVLTGLADAMPRWLGVGNRVLLTGRPGGMERARLHRLGLPEVTLSPLPRELQQLFVKRWFHTLRKEHLADESIQAIDERAELEPLVENPMLLTSVCILYDGGGRLPEDRYHLYKRLVENVLFNRFPGGKRETDPINARLEAIALGMHEGTEDEPRQVPAPEVPRREAERVLLDMGNQGWSQEDARVEPSERCETLLEKSGLLLPRGADVAFYHLSFQEYLAAEHLCRSDEPHEAFARWGAVAEWRPTLVFLFAALLEIKRPDWVVRFFQKRLGELQRKEVEENPARAHLLAEMLDLMLAKGRAVSEAIKAPFVQLALQAIEGEIALSSRQALALTMGRMGDPRVLSLGDPAAYVEIPVVNLPKAVVKKIKSLHQPLRVARYPVTNRQFAEFIEEGGYRERKWWSEPGWAWLERTKLESPRYVAASRFNSPNQPVVGVSYFEAEACAAWAGGRLLVETEWEAVARGARGGAYAWGDDWESGICNTSEAGLGQPSAVGIFPRARCTEYAVHDMTGNVLEWCAPGPDEDRSVGVLRGGSWYNNRNLALSEDRVPSDPFHRSYVVGFRLCLASPS